MVTDIQVRDPQTAKSNRIVTLLHGDEPHPMVRRLIRSSGTSRGDGDAFLVGGWVIYLALVAQLLYVKNRRGFFVVFALLCCLLMVNTVGCHTYFPEKGPYYP
jgi:hypothetical protein